jgi:hemoglobin-like flavoprotein
MSVFLNVPAKIQKVPASGARTLAHFYQCLLQTHPILHSSNQNMGEQWHYIQKEVFAYVFV